MNGIRMDACHRWYGYCGPRDHPYTTYSMPFTNHNCAVSSFWREKWGSNYFRLTVNSYGTIPCNKIQFLENTLCLFYEHSRWLAVWLTASSNSNFDLRCACISWLIKYYGCVGVIFSSRSLSLHPTRWRWTIDTDITQHDIALYLAGPMTFIFRCFLCVRLFYLILLRFINFVWFEIIAVAAITQRRVHWNSLEIKFFFSIIVCICCNQWGFK